jgi:hypothetical protein
MRESRVTWRRRLRIADCGFGFRDLFTARFHAQSAIRICNQAHTFRKTLFLYNAHRIKNQIPTKHSAYSSEAFIGASQLANAES